MTAWRFSTAGCRTASATTSGTASAAATSTWWSARAARCSRRSATRPYRRRRRARHVLQAGRERRATTAAMSRSCARTGRRAGRAGVGDAVARVVPATRTSGRYDAGHARRAASSIARWRRSASSTCARSSRPRARTSCSARRCARRWRRASPGEQIDRPAQPPRLRDGRVLPAVRRVARVPALQRLADGAQGSAPRPLPLLQLRDAVPRRCARVRRRVPRAARLRHRAGRGRGARAFPGARVARVDRDTDPAAGRHRRACCARFARAASSTSWSARR